MKVVIDSFKESHLLPPEYLLTPKAANAKLLGRTIFIYYLGGGDQNS